VLDGSSVRRCQTTFYYMAVLFISRMSFLAPTLDDADPHFALMMMITPSFYLHLVEVADQDPASNL